jgi:clan AA aspartic protease
MGLIRAELEVANWSDIHLSKKGIIPKEKIRKMNVKFLVDSGASMMAINEDVVAQLGLEKVDSRLAEMANGETIHLDVVGPLELRFGTRRSSVDAMVLPGNSECLLGAIPMQDLDLVIFEKEEKIMINPEQPYISKKPLK